MNTAWKSSLVAICLILTGCNELSGVIGIQETLTYLKPRELDSKTKKLCRQNPSDPRCAPEQISIPTGNYRADLKPDKKTLSLKVKIDKKNIHEIVFALPANFKVPKENGQFSLKSADSHQPVDLSGTRVKEVTRGDLTTSTDSCRYQMPIGQTCHTESDSQGNEVVVCEDTYTDMPGYRTIEYYTVTTDETVDFDLLSPIDGHKLARFHYYSSHSQDVVTEDSGCH